MPTMWFTRLFLLMGVAIVAGVAPAAVGAAPSNDDFSSATALDGDSGDVTGTNFGATKESGEPHHAGNPGGHSVWYSWTAGADGHLFVSLEGSAFDTVLGIYTGTSVDTLTPVASNDDDPSSVTPLTSAVSFSVTNGVTYMIAVDGFIGKVGRVELSFGPSPPNDNFADAVLLPSSDFGAAAGSVRGATGEPGEPGALFPLQSVWFRWTAPADGTYKFDTFGSLFDTVLFVFKGSSFEELSRVGINDDDPDRGCCSSWVPIKNAVAGSTYSIAVASLGRGCRNCNLTLRWSHLMLGGPGSQTIVGTAAPEDIRGQGGDDVLRGGGGDDVVVGGSGDDRTFGGSGSDMLVDRLGLDRLFGGEGTDWLNAIDYFFSSDRGPDRLSGGPGPDTCRGDPNDVRVSCGL